MSLKGYPLQVLIGAPAVTIETTDKEATPFPELIKKRFSYSSLHDNRRSTKGSGDYHGSREQAWAEPASLQLEMSR